MEQFAGIVLALIAVGLLLSVAQHGPAGFTAWIKAKFAGRSTPGVSA